MNLTNRCKHLIHITILIAITVLIITACSGGGGSSSSIENTDLPVHLSSVTLTDDQGNIYKITGAEESVDGVTISNTDERSTESITTEFEEALTDGFIFIDFKDLGKTSLRSEVEITLKRIPTMIITYDEEDEEYYTIPFSVKDETTFVIRLDSQDILLLPVFDSSTEQNGSLATSLATTRAVSLKDDIQAFKIKTNDGENIEIQINMDEMIWAHEWKLEINELYDSGEDIATNRTGWITIYDNEVIKSGIYTFKIYSSKSRFRPLRRWEQDVFVQHSDDLNGITNVQALAEQFAPILAYNDYEEYYPVSLQYIFEPADDEILRFDIPREGFNDIKVPYSRIVDFMPYNGSNGARINIRGSAGTNFQKDRKGSVNNATVYYSVLLGTDERYYLNYHMLYTYDSKSSGKTRVAAHVFDRESITVVFDNIEEEPINVVFSGHLEDQEMILLDSDNQSMCSWDGGRVKVPWQDVNKLNGHPIVAVARGSHALYPVFGEFEIYQEISLGTEPAGGGESFSDHATWERVLVPSSINAGYFHQYKLENMKLGEINSIGDNYYLSFAGNWVDGLGTSASKFPPFTSREKNPENWLENAMTYDCNYSSLPEYSKILINSLLNELQVDHTFNPEAFVGEWVNCDPNTYSMARLVIERMGNNMKMHGYGKCGSGECDWGIDLVEYTGNPFIWVHEAGFKTNTMTVKLLDSDFIHIHSVNVFHDGTDRDYTIDDYMCPALN